MVSIRESLERVRVQRRSKLYRWLHEHRVEIAAAVRGKGGKGGTSWEDVATVARENDIKASRQQVHATWNRLLKDMRSEADRPRDLLSAPVRPTLPESGPEPDDLFKPFTLRK